MKERVYAASMLFSFECVEDVEGIVFDVFCRDEAAPQLAPNIPSCLRTSIEKG